MVEQWQQGTVFMRHIDSDGKGHIQQHQCWNTTVFIAARHEDANKVRRESETEGDQTSVQIVTQADYRAEKKAEKCPT